MSTKTYLFHELSSIFPLMEGEEFDDLVQDIKEHGLLEPIILHEEKILDGRNRYRACKQLGINPKFRDLPPNITPLDFVISENIKRRHLKSAQITEIGFLIEKKYTEMEKVKRLAEWEKANEEYKKREFLYNKRKEERKQAGAPPKKPEPPQEPEKSIIRNQVAKKLRVGSSTMYQAEKIKEEAKTDEKIAKKWEDAKRGKIGIDRVYQAVQQKEITDTFPEQLREKVIKQKLRPQETRNLAKTMKELDEKAPELKAELLKPKTKITEEKLEEIREVAKLPEDMRKEVVKETITMDDAKSIAEIPTSELRKEAVKFVQKQKKEQEMTKDYIVDIAKGKEKRPTKTIDLDMKIINQFTQIYKQVVTKMTIRLTESYNEQTKIRLQKIMKETLMHLQKELKIVGEIITVKTN